MSDAHSRATSRRLRLVVSLTIAALLALGSFWVLDVMRRSLQETTPQAQRTEPDYYVERFNFVRLDKTGKIHYHVSGAKMVHNPQDDSYDIVQPVITNFSPTTPPTTIHAARGHANQNNSKYELYDQVNVERPASASSEYLQMKSNYLLILPDEEVMQTPLPVELKFGTTILNGTGMVANQATRTFSLAHQVHGVYQPPRP